MSKRHITFLISDMAAGGAQRVASILCSHWAEQGDQVTLITFEPESSESFYDLHPNVDYRRLDLLGGSGHILKAIPANIKRIKALKSVYKDTKPDAVIAFMPESNVLAILSLIGISNVPVLVSERSDPRYIPEQKPWRILRRLVYPLSDVVICQTPKAAAYFDYHKNCAVLPNPLPAPPEEYSDTPDYNPPVPFISALGRLGHEKGFDLLIDAFAKIKEKFPAHHLVILGEGHERQNLESQITNLGLEEYVHLPGQKKQPFSILKDSCLYVMPSRFEGFPNALCEAMAHGLPVIASDGATQSLSVIRHEENALIVESENSQTLAQTMSMLLEDSDKSKKLGQTALGIKEEISVKTVCAQWDSIIDKSIAGKSKKHGT